LECDSDDRNHHRGDLIHNIGERTNVTGSAKFRKLSRRTTTSGAGGGALPSRERGQILDVNMDEGLLDPRRRW